MTGILSAHASFLSVLPLARPPKSFISCHGTYQERIFTGLAALRAIFFFDCFVEKKKSEYTPCQIVVASVLMSHFTLLPVRWVDASRVRHQVMESRGRQCLVSDFAVVQRMSVKESKLAFISFVCENNFSLRIFKVSCTCLNIFAGVSFL